MDVYSVIGKNGFNTCIEFKESRLYTKTKHDLSIGVISCQRALGFVAYFQSVIVTDGCSKMLNFDFVEVSITLNVVLIVVVVTCVAFISVEIGLE